MSKLVGILNITPDSFSDGGNFLQLENAIKQTQKLINDGADMIDIGAESTRPGAILLSNSEEWQRLKNIISPIVKLCKKHNLQTSIDTRHADIADQALDLGVDIINDVSACSDPKMIAIIKKHQATIIINHHISIPADPKQIIPEEEDTILTIKNWAKEKIKWLNQHKITKQQIIFDVGIGFGKNAKQSLEILENIIEFTDLGVEIYVGHSRKSFLKLFNPKNTAEKDLLTAKFSQKIAPYVDYIRVHNIKASINY